MQVHFRTGCVAVMDVWGDNMIWKCIWFTVLLAKSKHDTVSGSYLLVELLAYQLVAHKLKLGSIH